MINNKQLDYIEEIKDDIDRWLGDWTCFDHEYKGVDDETGRTLLDVFITSDFVQKDNGRLFTIQVKVPETADEAVELLAYEDVFYELTEASLWRAIATKMTDVVRRHAG